MNIPGVGLPKGGPTGGAHANMARSGKIGWVILWLLGIPLPILLIIFAIMA